MACKVDPDLSVRSSFVPPFLGRRLEWVPGGGWASYSTSKPPALPSQGPRTCPKGRWFRNCTAVCQQLQNVAILTEWKFAFQPRCWWGAGGPAPHGADLPPVGCRGPGPDPTAAGVEQWCAPPFGRALLEQLALPGDQRAARCSPALLQQIKTSQVSCALAHL